MLDKNREYRIGLLLLFSLTLCAVVGFFVFATQETPSFSWMDRKEADGEKVVQIPFPERASVAHFTLPPLENEFTFAREQKRPDERKDPQKNLFVHLKKNGKSTRVSLPGQIFLTQDKDLCFAEKQSAFWLDLAQESKDCVRVHVMLEDLEGKKICAQSFCLQVEEGPLRFAQEFPEKSPLRILAESRFLGKDLLNAKYMGGDAKFRFLIPSSKEPWIVLKPGDCLRWKEGFWEVVASLQEAKEEVIARVVSADEKNILFEAWTLDEYARFSVSSSTSCAFKIKPEELISGARVRSEKQMSCMLDKQWIVLKSGDWVLKSDAKWKILRGKEKEEYVQGRLLGDLFVFDRIETRGGQKFIQGNVFNAERTQMLPLDLVLQSTVKNGSSAGRKGK